MNKMLILLLTLLVIVIPVSSYADEDEFKDVYEDDEREGFGLMEQEREHDDDEEGIAIGSSTGDLILYGTITAILVSIGYTGFKIISTKRKSSSSLK